MLLVRRRSLRGRRSCARGEGSWEYGLVLAPSHGGRGRVLPKLARMDSIGLDTIAGSKLLQLRFGAAGVFQPEQAVMHGDRRARFVRVSNGAAIIRYWGDSRPVAVPPETLSLPPGKHRDSAPPAHGGAGADARKAESSVGRSRLRLRAGAGRLSRARP